MPDRSKTSDRSRDKLLKTSKKGAVELSEDQLGEVAGGKAKTADKAFNAMDAYIRG